MSRLEVEISNAIFCFPVFQTVSQNTRDLVETNGINRTPTKSETYHHSHGNNKKLRGAVLARAQLQGNARTSKPDAGVV